jgi:predicted dehydrogenase
MPDGEIVAACDLSIERAKAAAPRAYTSVEEMLKVEDLDFVDIATRSTTHLELISMVAERGPEVICQKPMAPDWATACRMVEITESHGVPLMIHNNWRWQSWYRAARAILARGDIGTPLTYGFRCGVGQGTGDEPYPKQAYFRQLQRFMIDEVLVHHIDTARFLFGEIGSIYAQSMRGNASIAGEDIWANDQVQGYRGDSVYATQAHFIDCLGSSRPFESGAREYPEKTFAVVEAACTSLDAHRRVEITEIVTTTER